MKHSGNYAALLKTLCIAASSLLPSISFRSATNVRIMATLVSMTRGLLWAIKVDQINIRIGILLYELAMKGIPEPIKCDKVTTLISSDISICNKSFPISLRLLSPSPRSASQSLRVILRSVRI